MSEDLRHFFPWKTAYVPLHRPGGSSLSPRVEYWVAGSEGGEGVVAGKEGSNYYYKEMQKKKHLYVFRISSPTTVKMLAFLLTPFK